MTRRRGERPTEPAKVLAVLAGGGTLSAERHFPFDPRYWLTKAGGFRYALPVSAPTVARLVERGWLTASTLNGDHWHYEITPEGRAEAAPGAPTRPSEQLALPGVEGF